MNNETSYAKIGFTVVLGVALVLGTLVYLGGAGGDRHEFFGETYFPGEVSGLDVGSAVNFRGVKVGTVRKISFVGAEYGAVAPKDEQAIWVKLAFDVRLFRVEADSDRDPRDVLRALIRKGLHATVSASGITGLARIELDYPKAAVEDGPISWRPRHVCIPPAPSFLQSAADSAQRILGQLDQMDFLLLWSNALDVATSLRGALAGVESLLVTQQGQVADILANLREASQNVRQTTEDLRANPSMLLRERNAEPLPETR